MAKTPTRREELTPAQYRTLLVVRMRAAVGATYRADRRYKIREADARQEAAAQRMTPGETRVYLNNDIEMKDAQGAGRWHMEVARTYALALQAEMVIAALPESMISTATISLEES